MQIVINIPYGHYLSIKDGYLKDCIKATTEAIVNGTILPKGHGRLIDADEIQFENNEFDTYSDYSRAFDAIDQAEPIIEADKEQKE